MPTSPNSPPALNDTMWSIIRRFDGYYSGANQKASLLIALNTLVIGGGAFRLTELTKDVFASSDWLGVIAGVLAISSTLAAFASLGMSCRSALPYLQSPTTPSYSSRIFFQTASEYKSETEYHAALLAATPESWTEDLCKQAFALACGLRAKHDQVNIALRLFIFGVIPQLSAFAVTVAIAALLSTAKK